MGENAEIEGLRAPPARPFETIGIMVLLRHIKWALFLFYRKVPSEGRAFKACKSGAFVCPWPASV
jgi:hypothetical protein